MNPTKNFPGKINSYKKSFETANKLPEVLSNGENTQEELLKNG